VNPQTKTSAFRKVEQKSFLLTYEICDWYDVHPTPWQVFMDPKTMLLRVLGLVSVIAALLVGRFAQRRAAYEESGLYPRGGSFVKDLGANALTSVPWLQSFIREPPSDASLEGFHDGLVFNAFGQDESRLTNSPFFTENFYFWASSSRDTDFLLTARLSFYGKNASQVIPWFHFQLNGKRWNLTSEFESLVPPRGPMDAMVAENELGRLEFLCVEPMRIWILKYEGVLKNLDTGQREFVEATFEFLFPPNNVFKYQVHWDALTAARAMSAMEWTPLFWTNLRSQNQERYSSLATSVHAKITFPSSGRQVELRELDGSRDHNFGIRNWQFIHRYIWWPPVKFSSPLRLEGQEYTYITGAMLDYGNTMKNMVVGGIVADNGRVAAFSGATPVFKIAPEWYSAVSTRNVGIGAKTLPKTFKFQIGIAHAKYVMEILIRRGKPAGLWEYGFMLSDGAFEIHEGLSTWEINVHPLGSQNIVASTTAQGLFEFGGNLVGYDDSAS